MIYEYKNYSLLEEMYGLLNSFPFDEEKEKKIQSMNLQTILNEYGPHSEMEEDPVANAIYWSVSTLQSLINKRPIKALDEVISFGNYILSKK